MNTASFASGLTRRHFVGSSAAVAGSLVVGFHVGNRASAQSTVATVPEVNAWVVVNPDAPPMRTVLRLLCLLSRTIGHSCFALTPPRPLCAATTAPHSG